jgi:hypothetical protein
MWNLTAKKILQETDGRQNENKSLWHNGLKGESYVKLEKSHTNYGPFNSYFSLDHHCEYAAVHFFERMGLLQTEHAPISLGDDVGGYTILEVNREGLKEFIGSHGKHSGVAVASPEMDEKEETAREKCRELRVNLTLEEAKDTGVVSLYFICNGKKELLKEFNDGSASRAATLFVIKNPGRDILFDELLDKCIAPTGVKAKRVKDCLRACPEEKWPRKRSLSGFSLNGWEAKPSTSLASEKTSST